MKPSNFPQANVIYRNPEDMTPEQVESIDAFQGQIVSGHLDGQKMVVVAWKPDDVDIARLAQGGLVYLMTFGGLPPHSLATSFKEAIGQKE